MKVIKFQIIAFFLCFSNVQAECYDSTGVKRLWAPNATDVNTPNVVDVENHGKFYEGTVVKSFNMQIFNNGTSGASVTGICTASSSTTTDSYVRAPDSSKHKVCPSGTFAHVIHTWEYCTSNGGGH